VARSDIRRIVLLNQVAAPLFTELAEAVVTSCAVECVLVTGDAGDHRRRAEAAGVQIVDACRYRRTSTAARLRSWATYSLQALSAACRRHRGSLLIVSTNPPILPGGVWLLSRILRLRYLVVVYDLYPDVLVASGQLARFGFVARGWRLLNRRTWDRSEGVITIGQRMARTLAAACRPERTRLGRVRVLPLWVDTEAIRPLERATNPLAQQLGLRGQHVVLCAGNLGVSQDMASLLVAAEQLRHRPDIHFLVIGHGVRWQEMVGFQAAHALPNLTILPSQPAEVLRAALALAAVSVVPVGAGYEGLLLPSRTFCHMAAGSAVLGICGADSDLRTTIEESQCGITVPPGQPEQLAAAIEWLLADPVRLACHQARARRAAVAGHSRVDVTRAFVELLYGLGCAARQPPARAWAAPLATSSPSAANA
jgi:glycosyltransferase involved in cell wall biosynthesis